MSSEAMAGSQPAIPLVPVNNNHASTESNAPSEPGPPAVAPSTSSSSSPPVASSSLPAGARTRWTTLPKVWSFCNTIFTLFVALATLILAFVLFKPQALSTKLAAWTSQKDYLEYCQNHVKQTGGKSDQNCQDALRRVLPPPPVSRLFRRFNLTSGVALNRGVVLQLGHKPIRLRWDPKSTYSASNSPVDMTQPDPDISGVGIRPLLAAELIFWLLIFFVTWHVVLKARRTSWQSTRMNTPVGVDQKTKVEKNVQLISGPYEAWVPDFVVRSFSSSIRKIRITQETSLLWQPSTVEINDAQPESTLRRRHKKSYDSTPKVKGIPTEISDDGDSNAPCDESDSELWIPVDRPQNTWFNDRHFEKLMPAIAALIGTYASILEVASKQTFTFYIDKVNTRNCETPVGGSEHLITTPAYTLPLSDYSRDLRAKLAVSPLVMRIRRNIMDHGDVVYVSPQLRSSWQLTLNKSDNFNAIELTSSIVKREYAGSSSFKSFVTKKMVPQMPTSSLISPFSSITFAVHEDQNLVSIFVDTDDEREHAWTVLKRELEALFVKGPEETLRLFRYPKGELDGTQDAAPLNIWIYHQVDEAAVGPSPYHKKSKQFNEVDDKSAPKSNETRPSPAEVRETVKKEVYGRKLIQPISRSMSNETHFALPSPALSPNAGNESIPEPNGSQASPVQAKQEAKKTSFPRIVKRPSYEADTALPSRDPDVLKQERKKQLQRYALAHGKTLAEVTSEQFEDDEEPLHRFTMEEATDQIAEDKRDSDLHVKQWQDSLQSGLGTYQGNVPSTRDIGGLAKGGSLRHRVRELIPGRKPVRWHGRDESEPYGRGRRNAFSAPGVPSR